MAFVKIDTVKYLFFCTVWLFAQQASAFTNSEELLPPDQAFKLSSYIEKDRVFVTWDIADGYFLYRDKFKISAQDPDIELIEPTYPAGKIKEDPNFGRVETLRNQVAVNFPIPANLDQKNLDLLIEHQGCADMGICYPPQKTPLSLKLPKPSVIAANVNPLQQLTQELSGGFNPFQNDLLPPDEAFEALITVTDAQTLHASWRIAEGYYLYRGKTVFSVAADSSTQIGGYQIPNGISKYDESFGQVEVFYDSLSFDVPLIRSDTQAQPLKLAVKYQGCAERGICYPPIEKTFLLNLPAADATTPISGAAQPLASSPTAISEQDLIASNLGKESFWLTLVSFFGFGLLLAFTPCIFPMIPILSGIIVGHGEKVTVMRGFLLSLAYVIASALAYTVFGILAALFGSNLQADLQQPWVIILFSSIFILLALSMFGFYNLELPKFLQVRLHNASDRHRNSGMAGAAVMGALSALIVGPCVAAPLAGALIYIGQTGDAVLGGAALFLMGLGMGAPLLVLGASAGSILPKAGHWLNATKAIFGVVMLAVSAWMLDRVLPGPIMMFLWALLLILPAIFMNALDALPENSSGWRKISKGLGLIMVIYGTLLLIGLATGNNNPLKPLQGLAVANAAAHKELEFTRIASIEELDYKVEQASAAGKWVMLDYYADWCISCKEMEAYTFTEPEVQQALNNFVVVQADVTKMNGNDKALLDRYNLIGPPAILFFDTKGQERPAMRLVGFLDAQQFIDHLKSNT